MSCLIDVIVPGPWWDALVYKCDYSPEAGVRVRVPVGKTERVGFVLGPAKKIPNAEIRSVINVIDCERVISFDLWDLALWAGRVYMCGTGIALKMILPESFLLGEAVPEQTISKSEGVNSEFLEQSYFCPLDDERYKFYISELEKPGRSLILFSQVEAAKSFFSLLPEQLSGTALLWPSVGGKKLWDSWKSVYSGQFRIVVAAPGGIFAPLKPDRIIVEDESNPSYIFIRNPKASARSLAGRRALVLKSKFITGGRIPSSKTFLRIKPEEKKIAKKFAIEKKFFITVDMNCSFKEQERGIEGNLPLTYSLIERTQKELGLGRNVIWILDRLGESSEVFCSECGASIRCKHCKSVMRSENGGQVLRCVVCGSSELLPLHCENCNGEIFAGKRPGLDVLLRIAKKYFSCDIALYKGKNLKTKSPCLILGTCGTLALCNKIDIGLIAWLDLDNELRRPEYTTNFQVFRMLWDSYWCGRNVALGRTVLVQARKNGLRFANWLPGGWEQFWNEELKLRSELLLPPSGYMLEINCPSERGRKEITKIFENIGLPVMDSGEDNSQLWASVSSLEPVIKALTPFFSISRARSKLPVITVHSE